MPAKKPIDMDLVARIASCGCTDSEIAYIIGVSETSLSRRCRDALKRGRAKLKKFLRRKQLELARRGSVTMLIWLGKQYLGQTDRQTVQQSQRVEIVEDVVFVGRGLDVQDGEQENTCTDDAAAGGFC